MRAPLWTTITQFPPVAMTVVTFFWNPEPKTCEGGVGLPLDLTLDCYHVAAESDIGKLMKVLSLIGIAVSLCFGVVIFYHRSHPTIMCAQPLFCMLFVFGVALLNASMLTFVGENTGLSCMLRPVAFHISATSHYLPLREGVARRQTVFGSRRSETTEDHQPKPPIRGVQTPACGPHPVVPLGGVVAVPTGYNSDVTSVYGRSRALGV